jgi:hypothetical protein
MAGKQGNQISSPMLSLPSNHSSRGGGALLNVWSHARSAYVVGVFGIQIRRPGHDAERRCVFTAFF